MCCWRDKFSSMAFQQLKLQFSVTRVLLSAVWKWLWEKKKEKKGFFLLRSQLPGLLKNKKGMFFAKDSAPSSATVDVWHCITLRSLGAPAGPWSPAQLLGVRMNYFSIDKSPTPCPVVLFLLILPTVSTLGAARPGTAPKAETHRGVWL